MGSSDSKASESSILSGVHDPIILLHQSRVDRQIAGGDVDQVPEIRTLVKQHAASCSGGHGVEHRRQEALRARRSEIPDCARKTLFIHRLRPLERTRQNVRCILG
jgi:hypothetical protein